MFIWHTVISTEKECHFAVMLGFSRSQSTKNLLLFFVTIQAVGTSKNFFRKYHNLFNHVTLSKVTDV